MVKVNIKSFLDELVGVLKETPYLGPYSLSIPKDQDKIRSSGTGFELTLLGDDGTANSTDQTGFAIIKFIVKKTDNGLFVDQSCKSYRRGRELEMRNPVCVVLDAALPGILSDTHLKGRFDNVFRGAGLAYWGEDVGLLPLEYNFAPSPEVIPTGDNLPRPSHRRGWLALLGGALIAVSIGIILRLRPRGRLKTRAKPVEAPRPRGELGEKTTVGLLEEISAAPGRTPRSPKSAPPPKAETPRPAAGPPPAPDVPPQPSVPQPAPVPDKPAHKPPVKRGSRDLDQTKGGMVIKGWYESRFGRSSRPDATIVEPPPPELLAAEIKRSGRPAEHIMPAPSATPPAPKTKPAEVIPGDPEGTGTFGRFMRPRKPSPKK